MTKFVINWFIIFVIAAACTCGGRTECNNRAKISILTEIHNDASCKQVSNRGVHIYEASKLLLDQYNAKTSGFKLDLDILDTCGNVPGALKSALKALVSANLSCLQPPHYLGIIGPDNSENVEAVEKVTSVLRVPHIVRTSSTSSFLHQLLVDDDTYIVQAILTMIKRLHWKSFTLVAPANEDGNDLSKIAEKLTAESIKKNLCVTVKEENEDDFTSTIVHLGKPDDSFFDGPVNATILVFTEGRGVEQQFNHINSANKIILLLNDRNELTDLRTRVEESKWWNGDRTGKFDPEELREVRWLQNAIESYGTALDSICKRKKCKSQVNPSDWNEMISKILSSRNGKTKKEPLNLNMFFKNENENIENLGKINVKENGVKILWKFDEEIEKNDKKESSEEEEEEEEEDEDEDEKENEEDGEALPSAIKKIVKKSKDNKKTETLGCISDFHGAKLTKDEEDKHVSHVVVTEMDDTEWWTMVGTVSGVGVAMFAVGILAVYVVYTNIRGPRIPKGQSSGRRYSVEDGGSSLRRVGSDREMPVSGGRNQRSQHQHQNNTAHQRDSIRSTISDRSV